MRPIPFYSDEEATEISWQRPALMPRDASDKHYDALLAAAFGQAQRTYSSGRWAICHPGACAHLLRMRLRIALARRRQMMIELDGIQLRLNPHCSLQLAHELVAGNHATMERQSLRHVLEAQDRVMDIGTGTGVLATLCARRLGSERVVAFEAHPLMAQMAQQTFALNGVEPRLEECAVGRMGGRRIFYSGRTADSGTLLRRAYCRRRMYVPGRTLREALREYRPTLVIIDITGGEHELIQELLHHRIPKLLIHFHPQIIGMARMMRARQAFARAGYTPASANVDGSRVLYRLYSAPPTLIDERTPL